MKPETASKLREWGASQAEDDWKRGATEPMSMQGSAPFSSGYRRRYRDLRAQEAARLKAAERA